MRDQLPARRGNSLPAVIRDEDVFSPFSVETSTVMRGSSLWGEQFVIYAIAGFLVLTIILMGVLTIDKVVVSTGRVAPAGGPLFVQPLERSIVSRVLVRPGDLVHKGQVLAYLDPTFAEADLTQVQQKQKSSAALVARLTAELAGKPYVASADDPYAQLQASIWRQRQAEYRQSLASYNAKIASAQSIVARSGQDIDDYQKKLNLSTELEQMQTKLSEKGYGSRVQQITAAQERVEASRMLSESRSQLSQGRHDMASVAAERDVFVSKWRDDLSTGLVTAQNELDQATQYLSKANKQSDLTTLRAPDDAVVLSVGDLSKGSVVDGQGSSKPLFSLVPTKGANEADVVIDARDIGFLRVGDKARVKFDAYRFTSHGTAEAVIETLSEGSFTTDENGQVKPPFFKARIKITKVNLHNVPAGFRVVPGMTLQADFLVGHRTILSYLLEGALRTGSEAMREPQ